MFRTGLVPGVFGGPITYVAHHCDADFIETVDDFMDDTITTDCHDGIELIWAYAVLNEVESMVFPFCFLNSQIHMSYIFNEMRYVICL